MQNWWDSDQVVAPPPPQGGFVPVSPGNPVRAYDVPKAQADLDKARADQARAQAEAPYIAPKAAAEARRAEAEATLAAAKAARGADVDNSGSAAVRSAALTGYKSAEQLEQIVADLRAKYAAGPGSTSGLRGMEDYLPFTENQQFDAAGNAARGTVGSALGFTGGQLNTATEAAMAVGPYLPVSTDRDPLILDKIGRLEALAKLARERSITQLGGVPDQNGNIHPAVAPVAPPGGGPGGGGGDIDKSASFYGGGGSQDGIQIASGGYREANDPMRAGVNARVSTMMQSGASDDEIRKYVASLGGPGIADAALAFRRKNPGYRGPYSVDMERTRVPMSGTQQAFNAVGSGPTGAYFAGAGDALTAGTLDNMTSNPAVTRAIQSGVSAMNPGASMAGEISGGALGAGALELGLGAAGTRIGGLGARFLANPMTADAAYGAATGAGNADDGNRLGGTLLGGLTAAGLGVGGRSVLRGAGNAATGVQNEAVRYLRDRGVPLTVGQAAGQSGRVGSALKGIEDRLTGIPLVGDIVNGRRREGFEGYARAAFDQGLAPLANIPDRATGGPMQNTTGGLIREQGVDAARALRSEGYTNALDGVRVTADAPFLADAQATVRAGQALPDPMAANLGYTLPVRVGNSFDGFDLTGNGFQQSVRGLRRDAKAMEPLPYGHDFGDVTRQAEGSLEGLLDRQAPGVVPAYRTANEVNRNVEILRDAVNRGRSGTRVGDPGLFAPSQLSDAAAANSKKFGGTHGTTEQPFFDLTRHGQRVLPSSVPDSGTAGRLALTGALSGLGALGGGVGYASGEGVSPLGDVSRGTGLGVGGGLGLGALLALGGTRRGQQALTAALIERPQWLRAAGRGVNNRAYIGGMFGAGLTPLLAGN